MMDHPNIAKVLDAGRRMPVGRISSWSTSRCAITQFCDGPAVDPGPPAALRAGLRAIAACTPEGDHPPGHQAVATCWSFMDDGKPHVKVIDFGIAKARTSDRLTDLTYNTAQGTAIGTTNR